MEKPEIPKRLASKIITAQVAVTNARSKIHYNQQRIRQSKERLDEFFADPPAFAARYYPRVQDGAESYPVRTTIEREQEEHDYRCRRLPERFIELDEIEARLEILEQEILAETDRMKQSRGRTSWPKALPSRAEFERRWWADHDREMAKLNRQAKRRDQERAQLRLLEDERLRREQAIQDARYDEEDRRRRATMTPEAVEKEREMAREFLSALRRGKFTAADVINHLNSTRRD